MKTSQAVVTVVIDRTVDGKHTFTYKHIFIKLDLGFQFRDNNNIRTHFDKQLFENAQNFRK